MDTKVLSGRVIVTKKPEFKIPEVTPEEIIVNSVEELNSILTKIYGILVKESTAAAKVFKIIGKYNPVSGTAMDILISE